MPEEKDFFISYHEADREWAEWITYQLEAEGYSCIIRAWDFLPGYNWVIEMQKALNATRRTLMILSPDYLDASSAHQAEWTAGFVQDPTGSHGKLIPIRVRECFPSGLLASLTPIDLVGLNRKSARDALFNGIRGTRLKPSQSPRYPGPSPIFPGPSDVLLTSLGDSPVVVSAMYDLLVQQEGTTIDQIIVLYPEDEKNGYRYVREVLPDPSDLQPEELPFEDANTWRNTCIFLKKLYACLNACQGKGDTVYLSLAGGRKSMAALTAWVAPIFPCIKGLYHVIDKQEENFFSTADLDTFDRSRRFTALHPDLNSLILVKLPFERVGIEEQDFQKLHEVLRSETYDSMSAREFETDISIITLEKIREDSPFLSIEMTRQAVEQFITLRNENPGYARFIYEHIMQMGSIATLLSQKSMFNIDSQTQKSGKTSSVTLHSFTNLNIPVRPVFYTLPRDIYTASSDQVQRLIICSLEAKSVDDNRSLKEIAQTADFSMKPYVGFEALPPIPTPADSILIVPLGKFPMVATQLYTLLREQEHHTIHEVVLIYPKRSTAITNSADIVKKALREEYGFDKTTCVGIPDLK
ncbi:MAG: TIR domain-containing protein, partial [Verrucomicrobia bacterium]|nr:TIR domain-containing protein [Verrucomicrobiota bacterium]